MLIGTKEMGEALGLKLPVKEWANEEGVATQEVADKVREAADAFYAQKTAMVGPERMRWLDRSPPATRIDVNLASARLAYWRDGKLADTRKVVVGKPETETPQLGSPIYRLVANPTWTVPRSSCLRPQNSSRRRRARPSS